MALAFLKKATNLLKRKPGGTKVGNFLRKIAHRSNPALGNGVLMQQEGEEPGQALERATNALQSGLAAATGSGLAAANSVGAVDVPDSPSGIFGKQAKGSYIMETIKQHWKTAVGALVGLIVLVKVLPMVFKKKH